MCICMFMGGICLCGAIVCVCVFAKVGWTALCVILRGVVHFLWDARVSLVQSAPARPDWPVRPTDPAGPMFSALRWEALASTPEVWVLYIKFRSSCLWGKCFYWLSQPRACINLLFLIYIIILVLKKNVFSMVLTQMQTPDKRIRTWKTCICFPILFSPFSGTLVLTLPNAEIH